MPGRADFGQGGSFPDPRNLAWVEQNLAPARFGSTQRPRKAWICFRKAWICFRKLWVLLQESSQNTSAPKMVFGRNLHLIGPFELFPAGFSTEFQRASLEFPRPGAEFWTPGRNLGPRGRHFGPGTFWGQFWGPEKDRFAME